MDDKKGEMKVKIEGPEVQQGRIEIGTFTEIIQGLYQGLRRVVLNSFGQHRRVARGRYPRGIEEFCRIAISNWQRGSIELTLEAIPPKQKELFRDIDAPMIEFIDGVNEIKKSKNILPAGYDPHVLVTLEGISNMLSKRGISKLTISKQINQQPHKAAITAQLQPILSNILKTSQEVDPTIEGKFYQVNLKQRTATLEQFSGGIVSCGFEEGIEMRVIEGLTHPVRIYGKGVEDQTTKQITRLSAKIIERLPERTKLRPKEMKQKDPILALSGLGKEIWKGVDPDEYVRELRKGWE